MVQIPHEEEIENIRKYIEGFGSKENFEKRFLEYSEKHIAIIEMCSLMGELNETVARVSWRGKGFESDPSVKEVIGKEKKVFDSIRKRVGLEGKDYETAGSYFAEVETMVSAVRRSAAIGLMHPFMENVVKNHPKEIETVLSDGYQRIPNETGSKIVTLLSESDMFEKAYAEGLEVYGKIMEQENKKASKYGFYG
ncbi:MAG: hypothetical protein HZB68_05385 [Candidatus Aenigmarchaeota archaeon]|nr:hypothetical protein [Candidatus Aenigmarchaeota archaeon]